jgi:hypothetical protein
MTEETTKDKKLLCPKACVLNQLDDDRLTVFSLFLN